jgi:hypothetical protein
MLDDASNARIVNNTVANNVTTGTSENSCIDAPSPPTIPCGHSAGLAAEANEPVFQASLPAGAPDFSNPPALFNNIFWNNDAMTLSQFGPVATLVDNGFIDFEVHGTTNNADTFTPRYSDLTNGNILGPNGVLHAVPGTQGNQIGVDPGFVTPFVNELTVTGSRNDPQAAAVTITGADPPVGLTGDYHLLTTSAVVDRGVRCSNTPVPPNPAPCMGAGIPAPTVDYDGQSRPQLRTGRATTAWDLGADELPGIPLPLGFTPALIPTVPVTTLPRVLPARVRLQ